MPQMCIICKKQPHPFDKSRSFHKFPSDPELKEKWMTALGKSVVAKTSVICNDHFHISSFHNTDGYTTTRRLLRTAVPIDLQSSVMLHNENPYSPASTSDTKSDHQVLGDVQNVADAKIRSHPCVSTELTNTLVESRNDMTAAIVKESTFGSNHLKRKRSIGNVPQRKKIRLMMGKATVHFTREDFTSDEAWTRFVRYTVFQKTKRATTCRTNLRAKRQILNLKGLVTHLEEQKLTEASDFFKELPPHPQELINRMKDRKPTAPFPAHLKNFARTLHFRSPAAYEFVRCSFLKYLPCVETLNNWFSSRNFKPGISDEVIGHVSSMVKTESKKGRKLVFNVTLDEMNIHKHKFWDKRAHEWKGVVDLGGQLFEVNENDEVRTAGKVLVFMLVAINGRLKTPIAHYIIDSLNGKEKAVLLIDILMKLSENNIDVVSVTFDGDKAHAKACGILGANFDYKDKTNFKPYFEHPGTSKPVYIFFDPCHMLKLIRNHFALEGHIIYDKKELIRWDYIVKLHDKQNSEGLHCACKIRQRHVYLQNEKMKVFLAVQVLSSSTAIALRFLEQEMNDKTFESASSTATFRQMFNDIFDVLNIKNKFCKTPGRRGITKEYSPTLNNKIDEYIAYIEKLEIDVPVKIRRVKKKIDNKENDNVSQPRVIRPNYVRKSVLESDSVRTGFLGFVMCLKNVYRECLLKQRTRRARDSTCLILIG